MQRQGGSMSCKNWMEYRDYLLAGEWHVHTKYSDGDNTVDEYCRLAVRLGLPLIVFSEHVRRTMDYDFHALLRDVELARRRYAGLIILAGCEASVLESGELDAPEEVLELSQMVLMAFHSFPPDVDRYHDALRIALANPKVDIWAHPGLFLGRNGLSLDARRLRGALDAARENNVLIELNAKYGLPPKEWLDVAGPGACLVRGSDAHSVEDLEKTARSAR